jgi:hypothetical protein
MFLAVVASPTIALKKRPHFLQIFRGQALPRRLRRLDARENKSKDREPASKQGQADPNSNAALFSHVGSPAFYAVA